MVVGGGIIAYSCALALSQAGFDTHLVDDTKTGAASYAAGILFPNSLQRSSGVLGKLNFHALGLWEEWEQEIGRNVRRPGGLLQLAGPKEKQEIKTWAQKFSGQGAEWVDSSEALRIYPGISPDQPLSGATWLPEVHTVNPVELVETLRLAFLNRRNTQLHREPAAELAMNDGEVTGVLLKSTTLVRASLVVCATGFSKNEWLPAKSRPRLKAQVGERAVINLLRPWHARPVLGTPGGSLVPRENSELWAGVTARDGSHSLTVGGGSHVLSNAAAWLPELSNASVKTIGAGVRPLSTDGIPVVGRSNQPGLLLAVGHGRDGVLQSPAAAKAILRLALDGKLPEWSRTTDPQGRLG